MSARLFARAQVPLRPLAAIVRLFWAERGPRLLAGALLAGVTVLAGFALLSLSGWFLAATAIAGLSAGTALAFDVFTPAAAIRFLALARTGGRYGERLVTHDATLGVLAGLRERLFRGWATPEAARALGLRPARLLFRLTEDIDAIGQLYLRVLVPAGAAVLLALVAGVGLGLVAGSGPGIALCAGLMVVGLGLPLAGARAAYRHSRRRAYATESLRARAIDLVAGQTELVMAGRLPAQCEAVARADRTLAEADLALNRIETRVGAGFGIAASVLVAGALLLAGALAGQGTIDGPVAAALVLGALAVLEPFAGLRRGALELGRILLAAGRLGPRLTDRRPMRGPLRAEAGIAVRVSRVDLRQRAAHRTLLDDVSLTILPGERVALVGASGAGKSSLLGLIAGERSPTDGTVESLCATLLTQRTELFQDTVRDNLRLAAPAASDDALWEALTAAGLAADIAGLPAGLDTRLGEGGLGLSGGQGRRLALARLLLRDTPVWLLDEPTEGLDGETARAVLARLTACAEGRTLVVATHIRREAELCDRLLVMAQGRITARLTRGEPAFDAMLASLRPD